MNSLMLLVDNVLILSKIGLEVLATLCILFFL